MKSCVRIFLLIHVTTYLKTECLRVTCFKVLCAKSTPTCVFQSLFIWQHRIKKQQGSRAHISCNEPVMDAPFVCPLVTRYKDPDKDP